MGKNYGRGKCDDCMSTSHFVHNDNQGNYNWGNLIIHLGTFNYKVGPLKELQYYYCGRENSKVFKFFFSSNCGLWGCGHETIELRKRSWSSNCKTCTLPIEVLKMIGMIINAGKIPTALYVYSLLLIPYRAAIFFSCQYVFHVLSCSVHSWGFWN